MALNANEILKHMIERSAWVNPENTVDTIKFGDGNI